MSSPPIHTLPPQAVTIDAIDPWSNNAIRPSRKRLSSAISSTESLSHPQLPPSPEPQYGPFGNTPQTYAHDVAGSLDPSAWAQLSSNGFASSSMVIAPTFLNSMSLKEVGHHFGVPGHVLNQTYCPHVNGGLTWTTAPSASIQYAVPSNLDAPFSNVHDGSMSHPASAIIMTTSYSSTGDMPPTATFATPISYLEPKGSQSVHSDNTDAGKLQHSQIPKRKEGFPRTTTKKLGLAKTNAEIRPQLSADRPKMAKKRKSQASQKSQQPTWHVKQSEIQLNGGQVVGLSQTVVVTPKENPKTVRSPRERMNRFLGACDKHRENHKSCDLSCFPYLRCAQGIAPGLFRLQDIRLFRYGPAVGHPLETSRNELFKLEDVQGLIAEHRTICLTQGLDHVLFVSVAEFLPRSGDKTKHIWFRNGEKRELAMPPYCLANIAETRNAVLTYINTSKHKYLDMVIEESGEITKALLSCAVKFVKKIGSPMVQGVLDILAINRMIERDWRIIGSETLGLNPVTEEDCPWYNTVPATPMVDTGLDQIVIKDYLERRRKHALSELEKRFQGRAKQDRFEVLLTMFIFSKNIELLLRHSRRNAVRYQAPKRYNCIELAQEYFRGHNILLSYYHVFMKDSTSNARKRKRRDTLMVPTCSSFLPEQTSFLNTIQDLVSNQVEHARQLREQKKYEEELHWSHQLFEMGWQPESLDIVDERYTC